LSQFYATGEDNG